MKGQIRTYHIMMVIAQVVALIVWFVFMQQVVLQLNYNDCIKDKDKVLYTRCSADTYDTFVHEANIEGITAMGSTTHAKVYGKEGVCLADVRHIMPSGLSALKVEMIAGTGQFLATDTSGLLIPASMAKLLYESTDIVGKELRWRKMGALATANVENVVGVYVDFPVNCELNNVIYKVKNYTEEERHLTLDFYLRIKELSKLNATDSISYSQFRTVNETGINIHSLFEFGNDKDHASHIFFVMLLCSSLVIAIVMLGSLCTAIAEVPSLMKTYNTLMVLGTTKGQIRTNLLMRYVLMSVSAFVIASLVIGVLHKDAPVWMLPLMLGIALSIGFVSGIYPAYYATHQPLTIVTRGRYAVSRRGKWLRAIMLCIMFGMTFVVLAYFVVVFFYAKKVVIEDAGTRYFNEIYLANQMAVFAGCCLLTTVFCLISIAIIERKYMLHSIQILHIIGMTRGQVLLMKVRHYIWLMCIGAIIASPIVWMLTRHWLVEP